MSEQDHVYILTESAEQIKKKANLSGPYQADQSTFSEVLQKLVGKKLEACSATHENLVKLIDEDVEEFQPEEYRTEIGMLNQFTMILHLAFSEHYPISLSPDVIWNLIAQSFATYVHKHSEDLRSKIVAHKGQAEITVRRDDFVRGSANNKWELVFEEFTGHIKKHIGEKNYDMIVADFSTTGPIEKACSEIVLMDAMQSFFRYELQTMCGIPGIHLLGNQSDWEKILQKVDALSKFDDTLQKWCNTLRNIITQFIDAYDNKIDQDFWNSLYKFREISGGPYVTGWINALFLFVRNSSSKKLELNKYAFGDFEHADNELKQFPKGISKTPFVWSYFGQKLNMEFMGGIVGATWDSKLQALVPRFGWAVVEEAVAS